MIREEKANELFNKKIDELTKEEMEELEDEIEFENEGIATYNQLVMDGYISDID